MADKRKQVNVYLSPEVMAKLDEIKDTYGTPYSVFIAKAVELHLKRIDMHKAEYAALLSEGRD